MNFNAGIVTNLLLTLFLMFTVKSVHSIECANDNFGLKI